MRLALAPLREREFRLSRVASYDALGSIVAVPVLDLPGVPQSTTA